MTIGLTVSAHFWMNLVFPALQILPPRVKENPARKQPAIRTAAMQTAAVQTMINQKIGGIQNGTEISGRFTQ